MEQDSSCASRNFETAAGHVGIWNRIAVVLVGTLRQQLARRNFETAAGHVGIWSRIAVVLVGTLRQQLC